MSESEIKANDRLAADYFNIWDNYPIQVFTNRLENKWISQLVKPGEDILFAGSGGGREIDSVLGVAGRIAAIDISSEMLNEGKMRYENKDIEWHLGDIQKSQEHLGRFDHIFALGGVFAYLKKPDNAMQLLSLLLNQPGTLTICVMNSQHNTEKEGVQEFKDGRIRRAFAVEEIHGMMRNAGLNIMDTKGFRFVVDNLPSLWNRNQSNDQEINKLFEDVIDIEERLIGHLEPKYGKFIWVTGNK